MQNYLRKQTLKACILSLFELIALATEFAITLPPASALDLVNCKKLLS